MNKKITEGEVIKRKDIYFSFPCKSGQMQANNFTKFYKIIARNLINKDQPLKFSDIKIEDNYSKVLLIRDKIKIFLRNSGVVLPRNPRLEISYHYGIDAFYKYGMTMINIINNIWKCSFNNK